MDKEPTFTDWDIRALEWLPADGSWRDNAGRRTCIALESLAHYHSQLAETDQINGQLWRARLTPVGIRVKAALPKLKHETDRLRLHLLMEAMSAIET